MSSLPTTDSALVGAAEDFADSNIHRCEFGHPCEHSATMPFAVLLVPAAEASSMAPPFVAGTFREARKGWDHAVHWGIKEKIGCQRNRRVVNLCLH